MIKRYDLVTNYRCGDSIEEMERREDGEWIRYEDIGAIYCDAGCGALAEATIEDSDDASGYRGEQSFCRACLQKRLEKGR